MPRLLQWPLCERSRRQVHKGGIEGLEVVSCMGFSTARYLGGGGYA